MAELLPEKKKNGNYFTLVSGGPPPPDSDGRKFIAAFGGMSNEISIFLIFFPADHADLLPAEWKANPCDRSNAIEKLVASCPQKLYTSAESFSPYYRSSST